MLVSCQHTFLDTLSFKEHGREDCKMSIGSEDVQNLNTLYPDHFCGV